MNGFSLAELVVGVALGGVLLAALAGLVGTHQRLAAELAHRTALEETVRIVRHALPAELRAIEPAADLAALAPDSLAVRAFRALAVVCGISGGAVLVRYRGMRAPEPDKDSILVVGADGSERVAPLAAASTAPGACAAAPGESVLRLGFGGESAIGSIVLLFESGSYHLASRALRYRRGAGGRQPLTVEWLDHRSSSFTGLDRTARPAPEPGAAAVLEIRMALTAPPVSGRPAKARTARVRVPFLNRSAPVHGPNPGHVP